MGGDLGDVEQLRRRVADGGKRIAEHGVAEGAGCADDGGAGGGELLGAHVADALAGFFAKEGEAAAGSAAEGALAGARRIDDLAGACEHLARLIVGTAIAAEIAGIVIDDLRAVGFGKLVLIARHELAVMLDLRGGAVFFPVLRDGADAVGADGHDLRDFLLLHDFEVLLGELLEDEVVAEAADRIAGALLLFENAKARAQIMPSLLRKRR